MEVMRLIKGVHGEETQRRTGVEEVKLMRFIKGVQVRKGALRESRVTGRIK